MLLGTPALEQTLLCPHSPPILCACVPDYNSAPDYSISSFLSVCMCREIANGNTLENGLQKGLLNAADLRRNGETADIFPEQYFGTAVGGFFCMPPDFSRQPDKPAMNCAGIGTNGLQLQALYTDVLSAAACTVRKGIEALRAGPHCLHNEAASLMQIVSHQQVQDLLATLELVPMRDAALYISNWRNTTIDDVDFGEGKPISKLACLMPVCTRTVLLSAGPHDDGVICVMRFPRDGLAQVQQSQVLQHIAPEARFMA